PAGGARRHRRAAREPPREPGRAEPGSRPGPVRAPVQQARHPEHRAGRDDEPGAQPPGRAVLRGGRAARHRRVRDAQGHLEVRAGPDPEEAGRRLAASARAGSRSPARGHEARAGGAARAGGPAPPPALPPPPPPPAAPPAADLNPLLELVSENTPTGEVEFAEEDTGKIVRPVETRARDDIQDQLEKLRTIATSQPKATSSGPSKEIEKR